MELTILFKTLRLRIPFPALKKWLDCAQNRRGHSTDGKKAKTFPFRVLKSLWFNVKKLSF